MKAGKLPKELFFREPKALCDFFGKIFSLRCYQIGFFLSTDCTKQSWTLSESFLCQFSIYLNKNCPSARSEVDLNSQALNYQDQIIPFALFECHQISTPLSLQHLPYCRGNTRTLTYLNERIEFIVIEVTCFILPIQGSLYNWNWVKLHRFKNF